ncbi:MAG: hypothetical protein Q9M33_04905 [Robiginitomaculum sp.]|nr:hypothetical protein [Robiginitomaculum sp.]MDQ7076538.1 hypothetical protein [Robiginitomaculum sp.]
MADFIDEAVMEANVTLAAEKTGEGVYRCTLTSDYNQMVRDITVKPGIDYAPGAGNLLYHFALVTQGILDSDDLDDWAEEQDLDPRDETTKARYEQARTDAEDFRTLLGGYTFGNLMGALQIHQAIGNARP